MSKESSQQNQNQSEEVDLGQLFKAIGNAFSSLFRGIASIFKGLYEGLILILLHFYKRIFWYAGAVIIGLIVGIVMNSSLEKSYGANMYIKTNFDSGRQVYENIKQLHQLASADNDTVELGRLLNISPSEAAKIKGFYVQEGTDESTKSEMYAEYRQNLDSVSQTEITFESYKESLKDYAYPVHQIGVSSTDKFVFKTIEKSFIKELGDNEYLDELATVNVENLKRESKTLEGQVNKTDSLINEYLKIKVFQSQKPESSGTYLYMGDAESGKSMANEAELLKEKLRLESQKRQVYQKLVEEKDVISVISGFPSSGYDIREWTDKYYYTIPLVMFSFTLLIFLLIGLGRFLKNHQDKI